MKNRLTNNLRKTFRRGILIPLLLFGMVNFISAKASYSGEASTSIKLNLKGKSIRDIVSEIEKKTNFVFFYFDDDVELNKRISIDVDAKSIEEALTQVFNNTNYTYKISDRQVFVTKKPSKDVANNIRKITGVILDENNDPVIGATILIEGTSKGTTSDLDGKFTLEAKSGDKLSIKYLGYKTAVLLIGENSTYTVKLEQTQQLLDEVVVVGYGTQKKINLTGAINTISADQIADKPVTSLAASITGIASGVTVTQNSGKPGANQGNIRIRGIGTWENANPLVLVDGIPTSMSNVIPSQVASISVLKDAASAAIYGSRAANGVILITTKQGVKGGSKIRVSYDGNIGFQNATRTPKMASAYEYGILENQYYVNDGGAPKNSPEKLERLRLGANPDQNEANTDWYKELLKTGVQQMHQISASGGGQNILYHATIGYTGQTGIMDNSTYNRYNARLNTTADITKWMKIGLNMSFQTGVTREPTGGLDDAYRRVGRTKPYVPVKYSDGTWSFVSEPTNPVRRTTLDYGKIKNRSDITTLQLVPEINIIKGLVFRGLLGYESSVAANKRLEKIVDYNKFENLQGAIREVAKSKIEDTWAQWRNITSNATFTYDNTIGKHNFTVMMGGSLESSKYAYTKSGRFNVPEGFNEINTGDPSETFAEGNSTYESLVGFFGRLNYAFAGRYLFEFNIRRDGSSKFAKGHQWGTFPSFSGGWRISEESFFTPLKKYIENLKIRASWGQLGNQRIANYRFLSTIGGKDGGTYIFNDQILPGYIEQRMGYPQITWETSESTDIGLDITVLNQKLSFELDWYTKTTKNILLALEAPSLLGIDAPTTNAGKVRNRGWEITAKWNDKIGSDFSYYISANLSDVKNKILDLQGYKSSTNDLTSRIEGQPIDAIFGYKSLGIAYNEELYEKYKKIMKDYKPAWSLGDIILEDTNGDGKITSEDKQVIGSGIPRYTYAISLGADYKGFDFSCQFQGVGKADGYVTYEAISSMGTNSARKDHYTDTFDPAHPRSDAYYPRTSAVANGYNFENMSHWVQDASYLRMKNLQVGYTFKTKVIEKLRLYFSGENLFTITNFRAFDPEVSIGSRSHYPNVRTLSFGVNANF